jgi:hypothetical protein
VSELTDLVMRWSGFRGLRNDVNEQRAKKQPYLCRAHASRLNRHLQPVFTQSRSRHVKSTNLGIFLTDGDPVSPIGFDKVLSCKMLKQSSRFWISKPCAYIHTHILQNGHARLVTKAFECELSLRKYMTFVRVTASRKMKIRK